ncbi:MAG TPA: MarR family transcriptional regulator [Firmicutes bacterium]|nr:MarR family transcriptional regulator [Bacillota bacterium]
MREASFREQVAVVEELLRLVANVVRKRGRDILSDFDITPPQFQALLVVADEEGITMGELCQRMYLACSTATDLIDRMEKAGLVSRERDQQDRRVIRLQVSPRGHEIMKSVLEARRRYLEGVLAHMDPGEINALTRSLQQVHQLMSKDMVPA